ncbi:helix-turn-helix transcriptional regulator [Nocardia sp. NPDC127579]|uniref:helix-turn-helix transcriptional regulator n=1 Tax=Nocardia sp. NPDC127579 TaxID=3345402 RepID=UPI003631ADA8
MIDIRKGSTATAVRPLGPDTRPIIFAHKSFHDCMGSADGAWLTRFARSFQLEFADTDELAAHTDLGGAPILLPVNAEYQAEELRAIRARHAVGLLVAVTNDVTGHCTYFAIRSGANFVINVAIPGERQAEMICAQLRQHAHPASVRSRPTTLTSAPTVRSREPAHAPKPVHHRKPLNDNDIRLLELLRSSRTIAEIARQNYMSERSMYRRVRELYDALGVVSRSQLMRSGLGEFPHQPSAPVHLAGVPR